MIGWFGALVYSYYSPAVIMRHSTKDPMFGFHVIKEMIRANPLLNDAIAVLATQSSTQYGKEFFNTLTNEGRSSVIAHPYDKQGSGVNVAITYQEAISNKRKILLLRKLNKQIRYQMACILI